MTAIERARTARLEIAPPRRHPASLIETRSPVDTPQRCLREEGMEDPGRLGVDSETDRVCVAAPRRPRSQRGRTAGGRGGGAILSRALRAPQAAVSQRERD